MCLGLCSTRHFGFERQWISNSLRLIPENSDLLKKTDQNVELLGLGTEKIVSLKAWLKAMHLITNTNNSIRLNEYGDLVKTFDPSVEALGTWAYIHYQLSNSLLIWKFYSNRFSKQHFNQKDLVESAENEFGSELFNNIKNGLMSLLAAMRSTPLGSKFNYFVEKNEIFYKGEPPVDAVHPLIFAFCIMDWMRRNNRIDVHSSELFEEGGPARIFNLSSNRVSELLMQIREKYGKSILWHSTTAGLNSISTDNRIDPLIPLIAYYKQEVDGYDPPEDLDEAKKYFDEHIARRKEEVGA